MTLIRKITLTEIIRPKSRRIAGIVQFFESDQGQAVSREDAESLASELLETNRSQNQKESARQYVRPCLETLKELIFGIAAWPEGSDENELLAQIFGPGHYGAKRIAEQAPCHLEGQNRQPQAVIPAQAPSETIISGTHARSSLKNHNNRHPNTNIMGLVPIEYGNSGSGGTPFCH